MVIHKYALVVTARWETDTIVEWLTYNRHIGFDHCYLYCNDDEPTELYEKVLPFCQGKDPFVTFHYYGIQGMQEQIYTHFLNNYTDQCEWFGFIDADEFILTRHHATIGDFIESFTPRPDCISLHSLSVGNNGHKERAAGSVIENYTRRSATVEGFTKNLIRSRAYDPQRLPHALGGMFFHNPEIILREGARIVNVLNEPFNGFYNDQQKNWERISTTNYHERVIGEAFVYHVGMKSERDLMRRFLRGTGGVYDGQTAWKELYERGDEAIRAFFSPLNEVEEQHLRGTRSDMMRGAFERVISLPLKGGSIARGKPATQSSTSIHSRYQDIEADAAGVVSGIFSGRQSHCTEFEDAPWWRVDLLEPRPVRQIRVFNRCDSAKDRLRNIVLSGSLDGKEWFDIVRKNDDLPFGGVDGRPFIWTSEVPISTRFVRVTGIGMCFLDLDQVEVSEEAEGS